MYLSLSNQTLSSIMSHTDQYRAIHLIYNAFNLCLLGNEYLTSFIVKVHNIFKNVFYIEYMFIILFMIFLCVFQSKYTQFSSVQFICSVMSESLRPHELQHARPSCPSPSPGVHSNSHPLSRVMPSSHLILGRPLLLLPSIPPSIRVFSNESALA